MTLENGHTEDVRRAEPSAAEASRALAQRIARADVVAHGTVPFRSGPEPGRPRRRYLRLALTVLVVVLLAGGVAVLVAMLSG